MSKFNEALSEAIASLYDYSQNCKVSIELVQRLAQQLKLETFIDKLGYTVDSISKNQDKLKTQRLSIAGTSILIDIDFLKDNEIVGLSLSSGVAPVEEAESSSQEPKTGSHIVEQKQVDGVTVIHLDPRKSLLQFLSPIKGQDKSVAETILMQNLTSERLNKFPFNLRYLANVDRLSTSNVNLFVVLEQIGLILYTLNELEGVLGQEDENSWLIKEGFANSIGMVKLNDLKSLQLGLFLDFWRDNRYINHEYQKNSSGLLLGKEYTALISVEASDSEQFDYLSDAKQNEWSVSDSLGNVKKYKFEIDELPPDSSSSAYTSASGPSNWLLYLNFNHSIYLPSYLLEYLGISNFKVLSADNELKPIFEKYNSGKSIEHCLEVSGNEVHLKCYNDIQSSNFIPVYAFAINKVIDIATIIPGIRNFLVLSNILNTLIHTKPTASKKKVHSQSRRGSKIGGPADGEMTEDTKKRLRESLKLSYDVTDEEILGLNAISETAAYTTIQPINKDEVDLDTFMRDEDADNSATNTEQFFNVSLQYVDFTSKQLDLILQIEGRIHTEELAFNLKISNGTFSEVKSSDTMDIDSTKIDRFIRILNLTEDISRAISEVY
ncbi:uncharacterized protein CANTADRAFT_49780 [Suhomyces tanzawaensis NRRL Y-17324]|uniref:Mediator of RNA polymerase II transcription subunit 1 n=1 Tax=Suhomyces tanzawaensis NRRL Y-17324 TaxID=984487 RepID=A0A1E4SJT9_9ASCO|nr:uncharacterized protein CANTADRAFT_49780 [Suhomyces tanzawaensis NRRL Y-17324]ODV79773.1 hypothetical protein CANTADRAFT_49780 [Suhomyces tanzawaensis NRRL Y-17324]